MLFLFDKKPDNSRFGRKCPGSTTFMWDDAAKAKMYFQDPQEPDLE